MTKRKVPEIIRIETMSSRKNIETTSSIEEVLDSYFTPYDFTNTKVEDQEEEVLRLRKVVIMLVRANLEQRTLTIEELKVFIDSSGSDYISYEIKEE